MKRRVLLISVTAVLLLFAGCSNPAGDSGGGDSADTTPPAATSGLSANSGNGEINLSWTDPSDSDLDRIEITWSPGDGETQPKSVSPGIEVATVTGLTNGTKYTFTVEVVDAAGNTSGATSAAAPPADVSALFSDASAGLTGVNLASSSLGDVDDDGDLDLVITGSYTATLYTNDGTGSFSDASAGLTGVRSGSSSFGDVDGDGDLDLVITGEDSTNAAVTALYLNDGSGNFTEDTGASLTNLKYGSSNFSDVDNDGDLDLLITGDSGPYSAILYTNGGSGTFSDAVAGLTGVAFSSSSFGDVDGDGDLDLVISGRSPITTTLYTNDGNGNFTDAGAGLANVEKGSTSFGDVDGDGDLDLVITGRGPGDIAKLYLNDGAGNFTDASAGFTGVFDSASAFADVDDDGDLDLAIIGETTGGAQVFDLYINDGAGNFTEAATGLAGWKWGSLSFGDVDGDGDMDMVVTGYYEIGMSGYSEAILYENAPCTKTYVNWRRGNGVKQPRVGTGRSRPALEKDRDLGMIHSRLPAPSLRRHIRAYRFFDLDASRAYTVPAWTRHTMLFRYGDFFYAYFPDGSAVPHLGASLFGATTRPLSYGGTTGRYRFVAVEFRPAVMPALLREHADAFTDCVVEAGAFNGDQRVSLVIEQLSEATTTEGRCDVLNRFFESSLREKKVVVHPDIMGAIGRIDTTIGPLSMGRLAKMSGMSERTLRRRFKAATGLSPQLYHSILRAERALGMIYHAPGASTFDMVSECGFTDQSHLIHELRRFTLATPGELRQDNAAGPGPLRDFFRSETT